MRWVLGAKGKVMTEKSENSASLVGKIDAEGYALCEGCGVQLGVVEAAHYHVCLACTRARHAAVLNRGWCRCGRRAVPGDTLKMYSRVWIPCKRCLGTIKQLS